MQIKRLKISGEYHDLHLESDPLFLADVFENFRKLNLEVYQLNPAKVLPAHWLAWQASLEKIQVKWLICHLCLKNELEAEDVILDSSNIYEKAINKNMKDYNKEKNCFILWLTRNGFIIFLNLIKPL